MKRTICMTLCLSFLTSINANDTFDNQPEAIQHSAYVDCSELYTDKHIQSDEGEKAVSQGHFITFNLPEGFNPFEQEFQIATLENQFHFIVPTQDAKVIIIGKVHGATLTIYTMALEEVIQDDDTIVEVAVEIEHHDFELQQPIDCLQLTGKFYQETNELIVFIPFYEEQEADHTELN